jgi:hypothetical protein
MTISKGKKELKIHPKPPKILMISKHFSSSKCCNFLGKISQKVPLTILLGT